MKKIFTLVLAAAALFATSCSDDVPVIESVIVRAVDNKNSVIIGGEVPEVYAVLAPDRIADTSVRWFSSHPDVLAADEVTGVLTLVQTADIPAPIRVIITAMAWNGVKGTYAITVNGEVAKYQIVNIASLGFQVLDRNVGATAAYDASKSDNDKKAMTGNYYQWGRHTVVADGSSTASSDMINDWTADIEGNMGWNYPIQTPCPMGWTIPTKEQLGKIATLSSDDRAKLKLAPGGYFAANSASKTDAETCYLWGATSTYVGGTGEKVAACFELTSTGTVTVKEDEAVYKAMPVRCVKAAQ